MKKIIHIIFSLDSLFPILFVYLINRQINIFPLRVKIMIQSILGKFPCLLERYYEWRVFILAFIYILFMLIISKSLIYFSKRCSLKDTIKSGSIEEVEIAMDNFLPSYLGYFFVALSINDMNTFIIIFVFIYLFVQNSKQAHFNPMFVILGYKYYYITRKGVKSLIITKQDLRNPREIEFENLKRINNYTYID